MLPRQVIQAPSGSSLLEALQNETQSEDFSDDVKQENENDHESASPQINEQVIAASIQQQNFGGPTPMMRSYSDP